ncbi:MAG: VIT1/CCC1 transporter family protein [Parcubacteria group bacterium]|nr:VIT1/CCC1 transporter family protein [Parcubacteria group bacterium]
MDPYDFAARQYRDYCIYKALAKIEPEESFRAMIEKVTRYEHEDFLFWRNLSPNKKFRVGKIEIWFFQFLRKVFGLIFTIKILQRRARKTAELYKKYLAQSRDNDFRRHIGEMIAHEALHEDGLVAELKEDRVTFLSSIVLGLNDGLVELTGALVGFSFALEDRVLIAEAGFITGVAASLSMASSAYMQARYGGEKDPKKAGVYTGAAYIIVVLMLVAPFFIFEEVFVSLAAMFGVAFLIINAMSLFGAVLLERNFLRQAGELFIASIGVGAVAFIIGILFRFFSGVAV